MNGGHVLLIVVAAFGLAAYGNLWIVEHLDDIAERIDRWWRGR